jgi:hypothetical protein
MTQRHSVTASHSQQTAARPRDLQEAFVEHLERAAGGQ